MLVSLCVCVDSSTAASTGDTPIPSNGVLQYFRGRSNGSLLSATTFFKIQIALLPRLIGDGELVV